MDLAPGTASISSSMRTGGKESHGGKREADGRAAPGASWGEGTGVALQKAHSQGLPSPGTPRKSYKLREGTRGVGWFLPHQVEGGLLGPRVAGWLAAPDLDECALLGVCPSGVCTNTAGSFSCRGCERGALGRTCEVRGPPTRGEERRRGAGD